MTEFIILCSSIDSRYPDTGVCNNVSIKGPFEKIINDFVDPDVGTILLKTILTTTTQELLYKWLELSLSKDNFSIVRNDKGLIKLC